MKANPSTRVALAAILTGTVLTAVSVAAPQARNREQRSQGDGRGRDRSESAPQRGGRGGDTTPPPARDRGNPPPARDRGNPPPARDRDRGDNTPPPARDRDGGRPRGGETVPPPARDRNRNDDPVRPPARDRDWNDGWDGPDRSPRGGNRPLPESRPWDEHRWDPRYEPRPARAREVVTLRNRRPATRPWIVYPAYGGFYGIWSDYTLAPVFLGPRIFPYASSWCPLTGRIAYITVIGSTRTLNVVDSATSAPRPLLSPNWDYVDQPAWSPDGRYLAFVARRDGEDNLFVVDITTNKVERITYGFGRCAYPVWHPSGRYLLFVSDRDGGPTLYRIAPWGGAPVRIDGLPAGIISDPIISPDGDYVVFSLTRWADRTELWGFRMERFVQPRVLTRVNGRADRPSFSPDGERVLFFQRLPGQSGQLYSMRWDGSDLLLHGPEPRGDR